MATHVWNPLRRPNLGMADSISEMILAEEWRTPNFLTDVRDSHTLLLASDYGGEHATANYSTISILIAGLDSIQASWEPQRRNVRLQFANDGRRLSYKRLGDRQRARMLQPFLAVANGISGVIATFLIDRRIQSIFRPDDSPGTPVVIDRSQWKPKTLEKLLRVSHLGALLIAGLSRRGQHVLWISDQDAIAANLERHKEATDTIASVLAGYLPHPLGHIRIGTAQSDDGSKSIEDLLAIPDIAAGAWAEVSKSVSSRLGRVAHGVNVLATDNLLPKAHDILLWLSEKQHRRKRITVVVEYVPPEQFKAHLLDSFVEPSTMVL